MPTKKIITAKDGTPRAPPAAQSPKAAASPNNAVQVAKLKPTPTSTAKHRALLTAKLKPPPTTDDASASVAYPNKKRAISPTQSPSSPSLPSQIARGQYNHVTTKQQKIELIAQKEALHHVEMAWRAQQRLVRRCLGLRLFGGGTQSSGPKMNSDGDNDNDADRDSKAAKDLDQERNAAKDADNMKTSETIFDA